MAIEKRSVNGWIKCGSCGEQIRPLETHFQGIAANGKELKRERYCVGCERPARLNNPDSVIQDGERYLRQAEDYAAYRAAGCVDSYWTDRDNGYCN